MNTLKEITSGISAMEVVILLLSIVAYFILVISLYSALSSVSKSNRKSNPGMALLLFIPVFNLIWQFILVKNLADSFEAEYKSRGIPTDKRPTYGIGMTYSFLIIFSIFTYNDAIASTIMAILNFVTFIAYWIEVSNHTRILESGAGSIHNNSIQNNSYVPTYNSNVNSNSGYTTNSSNYVGVHKQNGYQGGYSGGHNNPNFNSNSSRGNNSNNNISANVDDYKSGDLYK